MALFRTKKLIEELGDDPSGGSPDRSGRRVVRRRDDDPPAPDESLVPAASRGSQRIEGHLEEVGYLCGVRDDPGTAVRGQDPHPGHDPEAAEFGADRPKPADEV